MQHAAREGKCPCSQSNMSVKLHHAIVERAGDDHDLEGGARLGHVRNDAVAPRVRSTCRSGLFGSKFGSVAIARISPVRGRTTMPEMLMGVCFSIASARAVSTMCWITESIVSTTFRPSRGSTSCSRKVTTSRRCRSVSVTRQPRTPASLALKLRSIPSRPTIS